ncbi:DUF2793 domain-containing protein [Methylobacterium oxalidis]|uniref:C1q domain-containing protein n=1 Tax=Methylobacterium oxalidis TaxID=944322 RepID=A0A512J7R8_9HYPH|nr:DUF2793 domain-containing protein [Methylobacterium oxalidis]GEP06014.1 hypothetical protein MOX02_40520 [Methylobacterium oxalidis]GJE34624.1 hypothetical protein LDDCCGHA_4836 [Methylobacterium oxalidis]GLS65732.1 hypothetical protein GCM10007888_41140 [Methylobacterium oxalidis]
MASTTRHLALPLLAAGQAQKHVTHNEALGLLDALVQLACLDKDRAAPPASPAEGDRYLLAAASPSGAWAGLAGQIVLFQDGVWTGLQPRPGWLAYVADEGELYLYAGGGWTPLRGTIQSLQNLGRLGVNTAADGTNRLAVKADAALFSWDDVTPGSGHMRLALNRRSAAEEAALVLQSGYQTRALFGLIGNDQISLKVSADGASFVPGFTSHPATGCFGLGLTATPTAGLHLTTVRSGTGAGAVTQDVQVNSYGGDAAANTPPIATFVAQVARGTPASPAPIKALDRFFGFFGAGWRPDGGYSSNVVAFTGFAEEDFTATGNGTGIDFLTTPVGATGRRSVVKFRANGALELQPQAGAPALGAAAGQIVFDSTLGAFRGHDGARWWRLTGLPRFCAATTFDNYLAAGAWTRVQFNAADANEQGAFAPASGRFTAAEAGPHAFTANLAYRRNGASAPTAFEAQFYRNGAPAGRGRAALTGSLVDGVSCLGLGTVLKLAAGDTVEVFARFTGADGYVAAADSLFSGRQLP